MAAARSCSAIRNRCSWLHTTIGGAKRTPLASRARSAVSCSSVWAEISGQSCFGKLSRETGQSRVPEPPDRMTGTMGDLCSCDGSLPYEGPEWPADDMSHRSLMGVCDVRRWGSGARRTTRPRGAERRRNAARGIACLPPGHGPRSSARSILSERGIISRRSRALVTQGPRSLSSGANKQAEQHRLHRLSHGLHGKQGFLLSV